MCVAKWRIARHRVCAVAGGLCLGAGLIVLAGCSAGSTSSGPRREAGKPATRPGAPSDSRQRDDRPGGRSVAAAGPRTGPRPGPGESAEPASGSAPPVPIEDESPKEEANKNSDPHAGGDSPAAGERAAEPAGDQAPDPSPSAEPPADPPAADDPASPKSSESIGKSSRQAERLNRRETTLSAAAAAAATEKEKAQAISDALVLADEAAEADDFALVKRVLATATALAKGLPEKDLLAEVAKAAKRLGVVEAAFHRAQAARNTLRSNADDPAARRALGAHLCFYKGRWEEGLPHLAGGTEDQARRLARSELAAPQEPAAQLALADGWSKVAESEGTLPRVHILLHARTWYQKALPGLAEAVRERVQVKLETIERLAAASGVAVELALDAPPEREDPSGRLSPEQRLRMQQLLAEFRKPTNSPAQQEKIVGRLLAIGGPAASQLLTLVNQQLQPQLSRYGQAFQQEAARIAAGRTGGSNLQEIERLRAQVLALRERANLTKEMIVQEGDPAMARLEEILVVSREMILSRSAKLGEDRKRLLLVGRHWERCAQHIVQHAAPPTGPPADRPADQKPDAKAPARPAEAPLPNFEKYLVGEEELAAKLAMPMDDAARAALEFNAKLVGQLDPEEGRAILACNLMRQLLGLSVLRIDLKLCDAARDHSKDMRTLGFFSHTSPVAGKTTPFDRAKNFGTTASGENIAMGYADGHAANLGWFHSPGHHKNMLGSHSRIGLGVSGSHYTEMFGQ